MLKYAWYIRLSRWHNLPTDISYLTVPVHISCLCICMWRWIFTHHLFAVLPSCSLNEYVCASGGCVSASLRCDGHDNCLDSSDEVSPLARPSHLTSSAPLSETVHKCSRETKTKTCTSRYIGKRFKRDTTSHYKTSLEKTQIKADKSRQTGQSVQAENQHENHSNPFCVHNLKYYWVKHKIRDQQQSKLLYFTQEFWHNMDWWIVHNNTSNMD